MTSRRCFLEQSSVILLDLNGTFMFGFDRFGDDQDFLQTYRRLGGKTLSVKRLQDVIRATCALAHARAQDPRCTESFGSLVDLIHACDDALSPTEREHVAAVVALHEVGAIPPEHANFIRRLADSHRLGLVSNVWSERRFWEAELARAGVLAAFSALIWSSEGASIKPSLSLFRRAMATLDARPEQVVMVGDSLRCDIQPAHTLGMKTVWITSDAGAHAPEADRRIASLLDLEQLL